MWRLVTRRVTGNRRRAPDLGDRRVATDPAALTPSSENDYVRNRAAAIAFGKSLFWDMQLGSDGVQSCGTCHFNGTGTDTRTKNQINPNHLGGDLTFQLMQPNERDLVASGENGSVEIHVLDRGDGA